MEMIRIEDATRLVLDALPARRMEQIPFRDSLGRVLAEDVLAGMDIPPFDRAAMDGFALRAADAACVPALLELVGEVRAGGAPGFELGPGQAVAITTGAPVPAGADAVQMLEQVKTSPDGKRVNIMRAVSRGENIVLRGTEASSGQRVLEDGRALGASEIAVLAAFGYDRVRVWRRPRVALLATGDELVEVSESLGPGQIRNSNSYSLAAQLRPFGIEPESLGIARDDPDELRAKVADGLDRELLILSGGASVGPYDYVKRVFGELGVETVFSRVAMRPGKPTVFGRKGGTLVFALPGNPVSSFVAFENFVRPALGRLCGFKHPDLMRITGTLAQAMRQTPGRTSFLPALVSWKGAGWRIEPCVWKGSGDIIGFSKANALVIFPGDRDSMALGEQAEALLLPDFFLRSR